MKYPIHHLKTLAIGMAIVVLFSALVLPSNVSAETWSDDFTNSGFDLDPRWERGGIGKVLPDGDTNAYPEKFDWLPENGDYIALEDMPLWYGPSIKTTFAPATDFDISVTFDAVSFFRSFS